MENFKQSKQICYGVSVRNNKCEASETVAYQELKSLNMGDDIYVDVVRSDDFVRPELEKLIQEMSEGDSIIMYSIDTLLTGNCNKGVEYYKRILDKKINVEIYDFSGRIPKFSKFSRFFHDAAIKRFGERDCGELVDELEKYASEVKLESKKRSLKKIDVSSFLDFDNAFKNIYFAYEAYQIDLPTTLELLRDYCDIKSEVTFRSMAIAYECSLEYEMDFDIFSSRHKDILHLPKRSGSIPQEYYDIKSKVETKRNDPESDLQNAPESFLFDLVIDRYMNLSYDVYRRWDLLYNKKPKPRKPIGSTFKVDEFKKKFKPINE